MGSNSFSRLTVTRLDHPEGDYYATDPVAALDLMRIEPEIRHIWEPACGEGHLAKMFLKCGKLAHATDIIDRGYIRQEGRVDFLRYTGDWVPFPGDIVTNPPYNLATEFVMKALDIVYPFQYVAMFLPLTFMETKNRWSKIFKNHPPIRVWAYAKRCHCAKNGDFQRYACNSMKAYAWFVWQQNNYTSGTQLKWIDPTIPTDRGLLE